MQLSENASKITLYQDGEATKPWNVSFSGLEPRLERDFLRADIICFIKDDQEYRLYRAPGPLPDRCFSFTIEE